MIEFFQEEIEYQPDEPQRVRFWLQEVAQSHGNSIGDLNYIFCSDEYLLQINVEHLQHDTYTDIITFPLGDPDSDELHGDIFISIDRIRENADEFGVDFADELHRVMAHGVLHMCGFKDKTDEEAAEMRSAEDAALALWNS